MGSMYTKNENLFIYENIDKITAAITLFIASILFFIRTKKRGKLGFTVLWTLSTASTLIISVGLCLAPPSIHKNIEVAIKKLGIFIRKRAFKEPKSVRETIAIKEKNWYQINKSTITGERAENRIIATVIFASIGMITTAAFLVTEKYKSRG